MADVATPTGQSSPYPESAQAHAVETNSVPMVHCSNRELFRVRASLLVGIFRDEMVIQEKTVSIIHNGFLSSYVETLPIRDIGRVIEFNTALLCGLRILGKNPSHDIRMSGLSRQDVLQSKLLLEGLLLEDREEIEVPRNLPPEIRSEVLADAAQVPDATGHIRPVQYP